MRLARPEAQIVGRKRAIRKFSTNETFHSAIAPAPFPMGEPRYLISPPACACILGSQFQGPARVRQRLGVTPEKCSGDVQAAHVRGCGGGNPDSGTRVTIGLPIRERFRVRMG